jgi:hypothetical protein
MIYTVTERMQSLAHEAYSAFERKTRSDDSKFVSLRDDAPEWVQPIVYAAHGEMLPDDWRYECIQAAFGAISDAVEGTEDGELSQEFADGYVDIYNHALIEWLGSHGHRQGYVDEAVEEMGGHSDLGITGDIALGQYTEAREVFDNVWQGLAEVCEDQEDAELEEDDSE